MKIRQSSNKRSVFGYFRRVWDAWLSALAYFTVLPVGARTPPNGDTLIALVPVGAVVGGLAGTVAWLVSFVAPHVFVVATAFALLIVLTGAIHIDGFLDSCDALFASVSAERRLEILKDPRHGTFALAGFCVVGVFFLAALWSIPVARLPMLCAFSAASARCFAMINVLFIPDARAGEGGRVFADKPAWYPILIAWGLLCCVAIFSHQSAMVLSCGSAPIVSLLLGQWAKRRLNNGLTGDVYGFLIFVLEAMIFTAASFGPIERCFRIR